MHLRHSVCFLCVKAHPLFAPMDEQGHRDELRGLFWDKWGVTFRHTLMSSEELRRGHKPV